MFVLGSDVLLVIRSGNPADLKEVLRTAANLIGMPDPRPRIRVGSTGNKPEAVDRVPINKAGDPGKPRKVVMSLGAASDTDLPMPDLQPGDRLRIFAELELTTDYEDGNHPGLIGHPYSYAPKLEAKLLLAADKETNEPKAGKAISLGEAWRGKCSHQRHHEIVRFADVGFEVPKRGLPWSGPSWINLTVASAHPEAHSKDVMLVGQNEKEPVVDQDVSGIRVVRYRQDSGQDEKPERETRLLERGVPVAKQRVVVLSKKLEGLKEGEQLLVRGRLITNAGPVGYPTRISTCMFMANDQSDVEPKGHAQEVSSWKGHLSKQNGFNCLVDDGPKASEKFGVVRVMKNARRPLFVNMVAVSSAPFRDPTVNNDRLPIEDGSFVEVVRFPADVAG